jgi:hypothetical protein
MPATVACPAWMEPPRRRLHRRARWSARCTVESPDKLNAPMASQLAPQGRSDAVGSCAFVGLLGPAAPGGALGVPEPPAQVGQRVVQRPRGPGPRLGATQRTWVASWLCSIFSAARTPRSSTYFAASLGSRSAQLPALRRLSPARPPKGEELRDRGSRGGRSSNASSSFQAAESFAPPGACAVYALRLPALMLGSGLARNPCRGSAGTAVATSTPAIAREEGTAGGQAALNSICVVQPTFLHRLASSLRPTPTIVATHRSARQD